MAGPIIVTDTYIPKDFFEITDDGVRLKFDHARRETVHLWLAEWIRQVENVCGDEVHHYIPLPEHRVTVS